MQALPSDDIATKPRQPRRGLGQIKRLTASLGGDRELARRVKTHIKRLRLRIGDRHKLIPDRIQRAAELAVAAEDARREFLAGSLDARISLGRIEAIALQAEAEVLRYSVPDILSAAAGDPSGPGLLLEILGIGPHSKPAEDDGGGHG